MSMQMTKLLSQAMQILERKFGLINETMSNHQRSHHTDFFNTADPRVKICVMYGLNKVGEATDVRITLAVEEENRKGTFFAIGDRIHFDIAKFPEFKFHKDLAAKFSKCTADNSKHFKDDVVAFAKELVEKLA